MSVLTQSSKAFTASGGRISSVTEDLFHMESCLIVIVGYLWQGKPDNVKKPNTKSLLNCWFIH